MVSKSRKARSELMAGRLLRRPSRAFSSAGSSPPVHTVAAPVVMKLTFDDMRHGKILTKRHGCQLRPAVGTFLCCKDRQ